MLTIGKLTPGRAAYYCEQLPGGKDEYYTNHREEPGHWLGQAASRLGLDGRVDPDAFRAVLDARHPRDDQPLGVPGTTDRRLAGFDLCFSAPKSVSLAWALGSPETARQIAAAHDRAVADALGALEAEAVRARRGAGGVQVVETEGVVAAAFAHRTSRAGDPQLHTHLVVANATPDRDGRWSALDGKRIYAWAKTVGYLYQASLRHQLSTELGFEWDPVTKGAADLAGISQDAIDEFSKRSFEISEVIGRSPDVPLAVTKAVLLATRGAKAELADIDALRADWHARAAEVGIDADSIEALRANRHAPQGPEFDELADRLTSPAGLTNHTSTFDRRTVLRTLAEEHPTGSSTADLRSAADRLVARPEVARLTSDSRTGPLYSTHELMATEEQLVTSAARRQSERVGVVPEERLEAVLAGSRLSPEQPAMVASLTGSGAGVEVVIGRAGAGKTYALDAARQAWESAGYQVIGTALSARAAAELQAGAGIPSSTLDRLLIDLERPGPFSGLAPRSVVVVDEAAMVGTRKLSRLLDHAERARAKVVLIGDPRQLPEIEAGGAVAALAGTVPTSELVENRRQISRWEQEALAELRSGHVPAAISAYLDAGRITISPDAYSARTAMVSDWWKAIEDGKQAAMYALRRSDVADLNRRARTILDAAGQLGTERLGVGGREFAVGDRVICLHNDRQLGVRNGTTSTVTSLDLPLGSVTLADGTVLTADYLGDGHLDHGYATTIHKAQGVTVDRAFLLGSAALYREAGYVGLSRARERNDLYIVGPSDTPEIDPVADTIRRLTISQAETLAIEAASAPAERGQRPNPPAILLADPPDWISDILGPVPVKSDDRDRWARHAARLEAFAEGLDRHPERSVDEPLGPRPDDPRLRKAWELAHLSLDDHNRHRDLGIEQEGLHL